MERPRIEDYRNVSGIEDDMEIEPAGALTPDQLPERQASPDNSRAISKDKAPSPSIYVPTSAAAKTHNNSDSIPWIKEPNDMVHTPAAKASQQIPTNIDKRENSISLLQVERKEKKERFDQIPSQRNVVQSGLHAREEHLQEHKINLEYGINNLQYFPDSCLSSEGKTSPMHHTVCRSRKVDYASHLSSTENFDEAILKYHVSIPQCEIKAGDGAMEDCSQDRIGRSEPVTLDMYKNNPSIFEDADEEGMDTGQYSNATPKMEPSLSRVNEKGIFTYHQQQNKSFSSGNSSMDSAGSACNNRIEATKSDCKKDGCQSSSPLSSKEQTNKQSGNIDCDADGKKKKILMSLYGTKEQKEAMNVLSGVDDLGKILPHEHCIFLGKLWIFTIQQLDYVINNESSTAASEATAEKSTEDENQDRKNSSCETNKNLLQEMMKKSDFLQLSSKKCDDTSKTMDEVKGTATFIGSDTGSCKEENLSMERQQKDTCADAPQADNEKSLRDPESSNINNKVTCDEEEHAAGNTGSSKKISSKKQPSVETESDELTLQAKIEACISGWNDAIREWKRTQIATMNLKNEGKLPRIAGNQDTSHAEEPLCSKFMDFPLFGAISTLLPPYTLEFLPSVGIRNAFEFLSAKKTENSFLIDALNEWRKQRHGAELKLISLARHMIGISARMNAALSSIPPANNFTREWMSGALIVLTGSPREFIVFDCCISSIDELLTTKTKCLAERFAVWREIKKMPPLKGTGNVATISTWKTMVKEANEADFSVNHGVQQNNFKRPTQEASEEGKSNTTLNFSDEEKKRSTSAFVPGKYLKLDNPRIADPESDVENAPFMISQRLLKSPDFLKDILKPANVKFLAQNGICNADDLIACDKQVHSPLVVSMLEWRSKQSSSTIQASSCVRSLYEWGQKAKDEIDKFGGGGKYFSKKRGRPRGVFKKDTDLNEQSGDEVGEQERASDTESIHEISEAHNFNDPIGALSKVTKKFLFSHGITKSEKLLSTKTSVLAETYVRWRAQQGMTELKGQGSWSSISGWKATVRSAARAHGIHHLLSIGPNTPAQSSSFSSQEGRTTTRSSVSKKQKNSGEIGQHNTFVTHPRILYGLPFCTFSVCSVNHDAIYDFSLTIRRASMPSGLDDHAIYLTYLGGRIRADSNLNSAQPEPSMSVDLRGSCPILHDTKSVSIISSYDFVAVDYMTFSRRCGLIDLSPYGAFPVSTKDRVNDLKTLLNQFISNAPLSEMISKRDLFVCGRAKAAVNDCAAMIKIVGGDNMTLSALTPESQLVADCKENNFSSGNVTVQPDEDGGPNYLLSIDGHIEKGQTVELNLDRKTMINLRGYNNDLLVRTPVQERQIIDKIISSLSISEIQAILEWIHNGMLSSVNNEIQTLQKVRTNAVDENTNLLEMSFVDASKCLVSRRRIHWISERIKAHKIFLSFLCVEYQELPFRLEKDITNIYLKSMRWDNAPCNGAKFFVQRDNGRLFKILQNEITEEFLGVAGGLHAPFDKSLWCPLSSALLKDLLDYFSAYKVVHSKCTLPSQKELVKTICNRVSEAMNLLDECCKTSTFEGLSNPFALESLVFSSKFKDDVDAVASEDKCESHDKNVSTSSTANRLKSDDGIEPTGLRGHEDASSLCDELGFETKDPAHRSEQHSDDDERLTIITKSTGDKKQNLTSTRLRGLCCDGNAVERSLAVVQNKRSCIHREWYLHNQILSVVYKLASAGMINWINGTESYSKKSTQSLPLWLKEALSATLKHEYVQDPFLLLSTKKVKRVQNMTQGSLFPGNSMLGFQQCVSYSPKSLPLFLKIIWPRLYAYGWRMECSRNTPEQISYLSPEAATSRKRKLTQDSSRLRDRDDGRKKAKLMDELSEASLMKLPRSMKFILISSLEYMSQMEEIEDDGSFPVPPNRTVQKTLQAYIESIHIQLELKGGSEVLEKTRSIVDGLLTYFDDFVTSVLLPTEKSRHFTIANGCKHSDLYGCEYLLRIIMILPHLLRDMAVPTEQIQKIYVVLEDLINFLDVYYEDFFDEMFFPSTKKTKEGNQKYCCSLDNFFDCKTQQGNAVAQTDIKPPSACQLRKGKGRDEKKDRCPLVDAGDTSILTLFTYLAMSQFVVAHAGPMDLLKGKRKSCLRIGFPGIGCGHCLDFIDEGNKYFFASVESLATAPSIVANHLQRCTFCPDDVKQKLRTYKLRHAEQRKNLPHGSQSVFFNRVWKRLFSSPLPEQQSGAKHTPNKSENLKGNVNNSVKPTEKSTRINTSLPAERIFQSHLEVMNFIGKSKEQSDGMMSLFRTYYACLARGGQIWNTDSMPMKFNSEWLLKEYNP